MDDEVSIGSAFARIFDFLNKLCAFVLMITYVIFAINANWTFISNSTVLSIINYIMYYGPLIIVSLVGVEFAVKRNIIIQIVVYALIAVMVIFQFFPGTWAQMIAMIPTAGA